MQEIKIQRAKETVFPYIQEKLKNYILDATDAKWQDFFVAKNNGKIVAFGRIKDHTEYFEIASLGVDYYHRNKSIGSKILLFLVEKAKKLNSEKPIYALTHIADFLLKAGFQEITNAPEALEYKKYNNECIRDPSRIKIMKLP